MEEREHKEKELQTPPPRGKTSPVSLSYTITSPSSANTRALKSCGAGRESRGGFESDLRKRRREEEEESKLWPSKVCMGTRNSAADGRHDEVAGGGPRRGGRGRRGGGGSGGAAADGRRRRGAVADGVGPPAAGGGGVSVRAALGVEASGGLEVDRHVEGWLRVVGEERRCFEFGRRAEKIQADVVCLVVMW